MADIDLLADEYGTSEQKVRTVVSNYNLFEVDEIDNFFSPKFILFLQPYLINKKRKRINGIKGNLVRYGHLTKDEMKAMGDEDILLLHNKLHDCSLSDRIGIASKVKESKVKQSKANIYRIPTVGEISKYCEERNNGIDSEHFHDFYSSKGWMIGKNKMKDWKAAVRTWEKNNAKTAPEEKMNLYKPMLTELIDREYAEMETKKQEREKCDTN